jgi:predicted metal-dependent hydrolase
LTLQLFLPFRKREAPRSAEPGRDVITVGRRVWTVTYARHPRARSYVLRVGEDGGLRVTIPRGGSRKEAERFARHKADWIERERYRLSLRQAPDPAEARRLRDLAARELPARLMELAASLGHTVAGVTVRDQRSRWGSCSHAGRISLNWRLVQAPPTVRDYVLLHELMHLAEGNHSRRFWKKLEAVCPWHREARAWLRAWPHGSEHEGLRLKTQGSSTASVPS